MDIIFDVTFEIRDGERTHNHYTRIIAPDIDTANEWAREQLNSYFGDETEVSDAGRLVYDGTGEVSAKLYDVSQVGPYESFRNLGGGFTKVYYSVGNKPLVTQKDVDIPLLKRQYRTLSQMLYNNQQMFEQAQKDVLEGWLEMVDTIIIRNRS